MPRSAGVVLAAGGSRRMGRPKQLLDVRGRPLLERVVAAACDSQLDEVVVVLGADAAEISDQVAMGRARIVENPEHATGMSSSLRVGLGMLDASITRAVVILGDQPGISPSQLDELLALQYSSGLPAAALSIGGLLHPPVVMARELWTDLRGLEGDVGCRRIIRANPELVAALPATSPTGHPIDIDTPDDYRALLAID